MPPWKFIGFALKLEFPHPPPLTFCQASSQQEIYDKGCRLIMSLTSLVPEHA